MILTIKLNIGDYQTIDFQTNEYDNIANCYTEISDFLGDWVDYTSNAVKLKAHVEAKGIVSALRSEEGGKKYTEVLIPDETSEGMVYTDGISKVKILEKTTVVQTQNYVDVRHYQDYSDKSYKLIGYDNKYTFIAKSHVIRIESLEGDGSRIVVSQKSAWVITKLEWK